MRAGAPRPDGTGRAWTRPARGRSIKSRAAALRRIARVAVRLTLLFAIVVLVGGAVIIAARLVHRTQAPIAAPSAAPFPPFTSAFVQSGARWDDGSAARVISATRPVFNGPAMPGSAAAIVVDAKTGATLYGHNVLMPLVPASTIKLIVAATSLADLGPAYRFTTSIAASGPVQGDALQGDLYLVGGGDPVLASAALRGAVHRLKVLGVRSISGGVIGDSSLFGPDEVNPTWDPDDLEYGWAAPPSALTMDGGSVQFTIEPDAGGGLARIAVDPPAAAGRIVGGVRTVDADADNTLRIDPLPDGSGYAVSGAIPYGAPQKYWRAIAHPTKTSASVLRAMLVQAGITVGGPASTGTLPSNATPLWSMQSPPLANIIKRMAFDSDNHIAEQLLRAVGAREFGQGSLSNGIAAEHAFLASIGADQRGLRLADGSGLSPQDHVTVSALASVLRELVRGPDAKSIALLLPRVGMDGTVSVRDDLPADVLGRVLGKDGYIEGASGLAGFVRTAHHGVVIYAFLVDDWEQGLDVIWSGEDSVLTDIARM
jgi:D-alanyl-D-alanine carboxypeptidase/D-alanyl-D-alanine-endopeptidase (penicillin-binding protein 4)